MKRPCYLFLGDSITDGGRLFLPANEGLGDGYVWRIARSFAEQGLSPHIINKGHDGFTVGRVLCNLEEDCLSHHPDFVTILIGINNIAVVRNTGRTLADQCFYEDYGRLLSKITERTGAEILCMGPFIFPQPLEYLLWMEDVKAMEKDLQILADSYENARFLPLHDPLNEIGKKLGYELITTDGIHLTSLGHTYVSRLWAG